MPRRHSFLPALVIATLGWASPSCSLQAQASRRAGPAIPVTGSPDLPADSEDPPSTTDRIDGLVVSSIDLKPVARVLVTTGDRRFAALTDYEGRFSFDLRRPVPQGTDQTSTSSGIFSGGTGLVAAGLQQNSMPVQFQLRKPGYINRNATVMFPAVRSEAPASAIRLTIQPAATLIGRVDAESGDLPANFTVQLRRKNVQQGRALWNGGSPVRINADGSFRASNLAPGDYELSAYAPAAVNAAGKNALASTPGFLPAFYPNASSLDAATPIHISAGDTVSANLILRRATFYRVTVPIAGDAAQGVRAILTPIQTGLSLNYNNADRALEGYLPNGEYEVHLISTPRPTPPAVPQGAVMFVAPDNPTVLAASVHLSVGSAPLNGKPVALHPAHQIPVQVNAELTGSDTSQEITRRSIYSFNLMPEGADGFAQAQQMPRAARGANTQPQQPTFITATGGRYHFEFYANGAYVASATSGGIDLLQQPLIVDDNVAPQPIVVTLRDDYASLNVRIAPAPATTPTSAPGATSIGYSSPVAYALAIPLDRIESQNLGPFGLFAANSAMAPRNSAYPFRLPPGHYLVIAGRDPQSLMEIEYGNPDVLRDLTARGVTINLAPGDKTDIEVPALPASDTSESQPQIIVAGAQ